MAPPLDLLEYGLSISISCSVAKELVQTMLVIDSKEQVNFCFKVCQL